MGYLPEVYKGFRKEHPDIAKAYDDLAVKIHNAGPLDERTRRLVKLGIAVGLHSEGGIRSHARRALDEGAAAAELRHVVLLAFTTAGFPTMIAASKWVEEVIENHK